MRSWGGGIVIYRSYALYEEEKTYNVLKGTIPDFNYDVKLAVTIDGQESKTIPTTPYVNDKEGNYYQAKVDCDNEAQGEWDYNSWNLKVDYLTTTNTKCKVEFTSNIKKEDYDAYIRKGVATRRNTYRGKDITSLYTTGELYKQIEDGTFKDIYVGDYFTTTKPETITWLVADIDNYMYTGDAGENDQTTPNNILIKHHLTIIPAEPLKKQVKMNNDTMTTEAYTGTTMYKTTLPEILSKYITPVFNSHVIKYRNFLTTKVDLNKGIIIEKNDDSTFKVGGRTVEGEWVERQLDLMSSVNVTGLANGTSSTFDIGIDNQQYAIFKLKPELMYSYKDESGNLTRFTYWLKDMTETSYFSVIRQDGRLGFNLANSDHTNGTSSSIDVRPRILIG